VLRDLSKQSHVVAGVALKLIKFGDDIMLQLCLLLRFS